MAERKTAERAVRKETSRTPKETTGKAVRVKHVLVAAEPRRPRAKV